MLRKPRRNNPRYTDEYKNMCYIVRKRDKNKCQMPNCKNRGQEVHHIMRWSDSYYNRLNSTNCILLCKKCHTKITGSEHIYAALFIKIIAENEKT